MKLFKKASVALLGAALGCCMFAGCISTKLSVTYMVDGETYRVQEYEMDTQVSLPTPPTKEGYTFVGWYTDEACTIPYAEASVTAGLTLYAKFTAAKVYIVVNTNGGEKVNPIEVLPGGEYTVPETQKEGYTFIGYTYIDENGDEQDFPLTGKYSSNTGIKITAKYAINKYSVTFIGASEGDVEREVEYGSVAIAPAASKAGYDFAGWYTSATEQTDATKFNLSTAIKSDVTLYAKYTPKTFTITVNGAQAGYTNPQVVYGESYTLATPDRGANYEFVKFTMNGKDFPATGTYTWTEDIAVEVVWDGAGKDVMFYDGATELTDIRIESEYGADISGFTLPAVPAKTGYETDGKWYVDANFTEEFVATGTMENDIRLYAKYTANQYTITFKVWDAATKTMKDVPVSVTYNQTIANVPAQASRESYNFLGYAYNGETFDINQVYTYTKDITVEEKWELDPNAKLLEYIENPGYFQERPDYDTAWTFVLLISEDKDDPTGYYTYKFADTMQMKMLTPGGEVYAIVNGNKITPKKSGSFTVEVNNNGEVYTRTVKTVDYIQSFTLGGTTYATAWGANDQGQYEERYATNVWDKVVDVSAGEVMKVGQTNFIPEISMNGKVSSLDVNNVNVSVTVDGEATSDYNVANGAINFGNSLVGKKVAVELVPKYATKDHHKAVYEVLVNNGVNVYTDQDMKQAFANTAVTEINVLRNITVALSADQTVTFTDEHGWPMTAPVNGTPERSTGVYTRLKGNLKVNGNYFTVDGSSIPLVDARGGGGRYNMEHYALQNVHFSIFNFGERFITNYDTYGIENLNVIGNGKMDATKKADYLVDGKELLVYSGACIGIQIGSGTLNLDGVTSRFGAFAANVYAYDPILTQDGTGYTYMATLNAKDCKFENSWANNMYIYGFASVTLDSCFIGAANGAAVHFDSKAPSLPNGKDINLDCDLKLLNDTDIQNWVVGTEAWFTAYNANVAVGLIRTKVDAATRYASGGTPIMDGQELVGATGGARTVISNDKVNFAVLMKTVGDTATWENDNVGHGTLGLQNIAIFDTSKLAGNPAEALNVGSKYAKFDYDATALGFGYIMGLVEIVNS